MSGVLAGMAEVAEAGATCYTEFSFELCKLVTVATRDMDDDGSKVLYTKDARRDIGADFPGSPGAYAAAESWFKEAARADAREGPVREGLGRPKKGDGTLALTGLDFLLCLAASKAAAGHDTTPNWPHC